MAQINHRRSGALVTGLAGFTLAGVLVLGGHPAGQSATALPTPTFSKDVLPILQKSCQSCHHPGTPAPMSLMTFAEVRPWARAIKTKVVSREMPPWPK